jgi:hypothetical protein
MNELSIGRTLALRHCKRCGAFATGFAKARCGRDLRHNMSAGCPTELVDVCVVGLPGSRPARGIFEDYDETHRVAR